MRNVGMEYIRIDTISVFFRPYLSAMNPNNIPPNPDVRRATEIIKAPTVYKSKLS